MCLGALNALSSTRLSHGREMGGSCQVLPPFLGIIGSPFMGFVHVNFQIRFQLNLYDWTHDDLKSPLIWLPGVFLSGIHMFSSWVCVFSGLAPIYKPIQTHVLWVHAQLVQPTTAETNVCLFNCSVATDEIRSGIVMKIWQGWSLFEKTFSQTALIDVLGGSVNNLSLELFRWIFFKDNHAHPWNMWIPFNPIGSMYGIFTYIYHEFQPNVGKYRLVPWILWESTRIFQWDFNVMGKVCVFSDHTKNVGFQAPIFGTQTAVQLFSLCLFTTFCKKKCMFDWITLL